MARQLNGQQKKYLQGLAKQGITTAYDMTTAQAEKLVALNDYETCLQDAERFISDIYFAIVYGKDALCMR
jgi:hypothetical protein